MHLNELKVLHVSELLKQAEALEIDNASRMRKQELMFALIKKRAKAGEQVFADGVLEILPDGFGFLRNPLNSLAFMPVYRLKKRWKLQPIVSR